MGLRPGALARYLLDHAEVDACDIDPFAFAAIRINAAANGVGVATVESQPRWPGERWDLAQRVTGWLFGLSGRDR